MCKSLCFDLRLTFLSLRTGFSPASTVEVCAALASTSILDQKSLTNEPRYSNCFTVSNCGPLTVILALVGPLLFVMTFVFSGLHTILSQDLVQVVHHFCQFFFTAFQPITIISRSEICDCATSSAESSRVSFHSTSQHAFQKDAEECRRERLPWMTPTDVWSQSLTIL